MVSITFMVNFYYIYGWYYIYGFYYIYGWSMQPLNWIPLKFTIDRKIEKKLKDFLQILNFFGKTKEKSLWYII